MTTSSFFHPAILSALLAAIVLLPAQASTASPGAGLPPKVVKLIANRYSTAPDLERAAAGYAQASIEQWRASVATGAYDGTLARKSANAQMCLDARAERLGQAMTHKDLLEFIATLTSTRELTQAHNLSEKLESGHPLSVATQEAVACSRAGIP